MSFPVLSSVLKLIRALLKDFEQASGIANAITIIAPCFAIGASIRLYFHGRLKSQKGRISTLEAERLALLQRNDLLNQRFESVQREYEAFRRASLRGVLAKAEKETAEGNWEKSAADVLEWLSSDGQIVSALLVLRTKWLVTHATGEGTRLAALVLAKAYAGAAQALDPNNIESLYLVYEIGLVLSDDGRSTPSLREAADQTSSLGPESFFRESDISVATILKQEADRLHRRRIDHLALVLVEFAAALLERNLGRTHPTSLSMNLLRGDILEDLGRSADALAFVEDAANGMQNSPVFGPRNYTTQAAFYSLAGILSSLGRNREAYAVAERVCLNMRASGGSDLDTLTCEFRKASIQSNLGEYAPALNALRAITDALPVEGVSQQADDLRETVRLGTATILKIGGDYEAAVSLARRHVESRNLHPRFGPNHPRTLHSMFELADILTFQEKYQEAVDLLLKVVEAQTTHPSLGPTHPDTLDSLFLAATVLELMGDYEEALRLAMRVAAQREDHQAFGPAHPTTLNSWYLVASILPFAKRNLEGIALARKVARAREVHPGIGPNHPTTLAAMFLVADLLAVEEQYAEALPVAEKVAAARQAHPMLGPNHPDTIRSCQLVSEIARLSGQVPLARQPSA